MNKLGDVKGICNQISNFTRMTDLTDVKTFNKSKENVPALFDLLIKELCKNPYTVHKGCVIDINLVSLLFIPPAILPEIADRIKFNYCQLSRQDREIFLAAASPFIDTLKGDIKYLSAYFPSGMVNGFNRELTLEKQ